MAMYACRPIEAGEELCHSYLGSHLLLRPASERAESLHFACKCERCVVEQAAGLLDSRYTEMGFPAKFALTPVGRAVGDFKVSTVIGSDDEIVVKGKEMLADSGDLLQERPLAALEVLEPLLQAAYNAMMDSGLPCDCLEASVRILHGAALHIYEAAVSASEKWSSVVAAKHVLDDACVLRYVVCGDDRDACVEALVSLGSVFGHTLDCMREDLAYFGSLSSEWHTRATDACQRASASLDK